MKLIYLFLLVLLIIYIDKSNKTKTITKTKEKFDKLPESSLIKYYNGIDQYDILDTSKVVPVLTNNSVKQVPGYDKDNNFWEIKSLGFSNLFNYRDNGDIEVVSQSEGTKYNEVIYGHKMIKEDNQPKEIPKDSIKYENNIYNLIGSASNPYYYQYYYLYEHQIESNDKNLFMKEELKYVNYQVYEYLLVKIDNNVPSIVHSFGPRTKINLNDIVYLANGNFQLGPLTIKS